MQNVFTRPQSAILRPIGPLSAENVVKFQHQLNTAVLSEQHADLLVDMGQVESIDSDCLMALVSALTTAQRLNKSLSLCSLSRSVRIIFELTQLDRVFEILESHPTLEQAAA